MAQRRLLTLKKRHPKQLSPLAQAVISYSPKGYFPTLLLFAQHDRLLLASIVCSSSIFVVLVSFIAFFSAHLPPYLPLLYSLPWGEQQLVAAWLFTISPLLILVILAGNIGLGFALYKRYPATVKLLFLSATVFSLLLAVTTVKVILLVRG